MAYHCVYLIGTFSLTSLHKQCDMLINLHYIELFHNFMAMKRELCGVMNIHFWPAGRPRQVC